MTDKPHIIPKAITDKVKEIQKMQKDNPDCHIYISGIRKGRSLIMKLLQAEDTEIIEQKQLPKSV